jgi:hypothetical protein
LKNLNTKKLKKSKEKDNNLKNVNIKLDNKNNTQKIRNSFKVN